MMELNARRLLRIAVRWIPRLASLPAIAFLTFTALRFASYGFKGEEGEHLGPLRVGGMLLFPAALALGWWRPLLAGSVVLIWSLVGFLLQRGGIFLPVTVPGALFLASGLMLRSPRFTASGRTT